MKLATTLLPCALLVVTGAFAKEPAAAQISVEQLQKMQVIGRLGIPLGQAVEVGATVRLGDPHGPKSRAGQYYLEITSVGGKALRKPVDMDSSINLRARDKGLAADRFSLYEMVPEINVDRDLSIAVFCHGIGREDVESAIVWAETITDVDLRRSTLTKLEAYR